MSTSSARKVYLQLSAQKDILAYSHSMVDDLKLTCNKTNILLLIKALLILILIIIPGHVPGRQIPVSRNHVQTQPAWSALTTLTDERLTF